MQNHQKTIKKIVKWKNIYIILSFRFREITLQAPEAKRKTK
jgi:hypothetical protein